MVMTEPYPPQQSLGTTKLRDLFSFVTRNGRPSSLTMRYNNWFHRVQTRYGQLANRPAARWPLVCVVAYMILGHPSGHHGDEEEIH